MKRFILSLSAMLAAVVIYAQEAAPAVDSTKAQWLKGVGTTIGFSQLSLTNWAAGGYGQLSLNTYVDAYANCTKGDLIWNNELQAGYGFIESFETGYTKSDDRLIFDSKVGYKAVENLYFSAVFNFRSQFAEGYKSQTDKTPISAFFAPAYATLGLGIDYTPSKNISVNFAPLTGKTVMVKIPELRSTYGNADDQFCRFELGAQLKMDGKIEVQNFKASTSVTLFSDYLNKPLNIKVNWDANVEAKISKYFSVTLRTNMIYDDNIKLTKVNDRTGETYQAAGVQFKELFSIGFTYTIGDKKK